MKYIHFSLHNKARAIRRTAKQVNKKPLWKRKAVWSVPASGLMVFGVIMATHMVSAAPNISGVVFHDFNGNGVRDNAAASNPAIAADRGVAGITVKVYAADGSLCDTQTTSATGTYTMNMAACAGTQFRVEYSNLPAGYNPTQVASGSNTTTQFVNAGGTSNLGIYRSDDYARNNPTLSTSIYSFGSRTGPSASQPALYAFPYTSTDMDTPPVVLGTYGQVGSTWGQAYRPTTNSFFTSAFMKRHSDFGPGGPGAIYRVSPVPTTGAATPSLFATIPNAGTNPHPVSNTNCNSVDGQTSTATSACWEHDQFSFDAVGKRGLGGMALAPDPTNSANDALLVVNLNDRQIYKVTNLGGTPTPTGYTMPLTLPGATKGCAQADVRPFGVTIKNGIGYASFTCTAESTNNTADLRGYVYSFNPTTMTFASTPTLEIPLNYGRSCSRTSSGTCAVSGNYRTWEDDYYGPNVTVTTGAAGNTTRGMQPWLSDISFGDNGSMTLGVRDRFGDQAGYQVFGTNPADNTSASAVQSGDILRACLVGSTWQLESGGQCNGVGPGPAGETSVLPGTSPQGPGGYEFYNNDTFFDESGNAYTHDETVLGGLAQPPGFDNVTASNMNPLDGFNDGSWSEGIRWYNSADGTRTNSYRLYQTPPPGSGTSGYFGKANGLGDVAYMSEPAPIEIGNRVWKDINGNGVQEAAEAPIAGVTVGLYSSGGTLLGTAVTDAAGQYLFSSRTNDPDGVAMTSTASSRYGIAGLTPNTAGYQLRLSTAADYASPTRLQNLILTRQDSTTAFGNDQNDSDASLSNAAQPPSSTNAPVITFSTAETGANNHNYDFGFTESVSIGNFVWNDQNNDGIVNGSEATSGINGITVNLYSCTADTDSNGSLSAAEITAATPAATTTTANDTRAGATNGRPGYYSFGNLVPGCYYVQVAGSNFGAGQPLEGYAVSAGTPAGDTQDDNRNHGSLPSGGTPAANGYVSSAINLTPGSEPTSSTTKTDDDTNANSDMTIDFGFFHPYSLGNRVWLDSDNSATINAADGVTPGVSGVTVNLLNTSNAVVATATTDAQGYYRFDNLSAGSYIVEIPASNFGAGQPLANYQVSSTGAAQSNNPNDNADSNDDGINPAAAGQAVRSGTVTLGPGAVEPTGESDLAVSGQGTADNYANMTIDFGFIVPKVSLGNYVWFDANNDGIVNGTDSTQGLNGVTVNLYASSADTDSNGSLSAAEITAATPAATTTTANDTRAGATNGRPGYYSFGNLDQGNYFVAIPGSNFGAGQPLNLLTASPVPSGVGDTQSDNRSHGAVPVGGSLAANGAVSARINLQAGAEPTTSTANPDDDTNANSDMTIDFGFWHPYSLGNRVWMDLNNSATIDSADGANPGVAGVTVNLLDSLGNIVDTQITDADGYYRFDNLSAGSYQVELPAINFGAGQPLEASKVSSINTPESNNPNDDVDSNDDGINPATSGAAVRSGMVTLGIGGVEPTAETDLAAGGQGTDNSFANMTVDFGFAVPPYKGDTVYFDYDGDQTQDANEPGIPNVTVTIYSAGPDGDLNATADNVLVNTATTNSQGKYLFTDLTPGVAYRVQVDATDVAGVATTPVFFNNPPLASGEGYLTDDFGFDGDGVLGNQVWKEIVNNGTYDPTEGDQPISGVTIELYMDANGNCTIDPTETLIATTTTDANGHYQFTNLVLDDNIAANGAGARYFVRVVDSTNILNNLAYSVGPNPGANNNSQNPAGYCMTLTTTAPSNQTGDFGYHGTGRVGDTVWYDVDKDGSQDPNEPILPNIPVTITYPGPDGDCSTAADNTTRSTTTDTNGKYLFDEMLGGDYCISITPPAGTTITTNNQGEEFPLDDGEEDLTHDFGVVGPGKFGNQVYIDYDEDGTYDGDDRGIPGVTVDLVYDKNGNGVVDPGEPVIKTTTTDDDGRYEFPDLLNNDADPTNGPGAPYIAIITDTGSKLVNYTHVPGDGSTNDNQSKDPTGYPFELTQAVPENQTGDFGYSVDPDLVDPPIFPKKQEVNGGKIHYTLTWINHSAINTVKTEINDNIPAGTSYAADSLQCQANGSSVTSACSYNSSSNRIEWRGTVGADAGNSDAASAANEIVITFDVTMAPDTVKVTNQAYGMYDQNGDNFIDDHDGNVPDDGKPSDNDETLDVDDPNIYTRTLSPAGDNGSPAGGSGGLVDTGTAIGVGAVIAAALTGVAVIVTRRRRRFYQP